MALRVGSIRALVTLGVVALGSLPSAVVAAQGDPLAEPPGQDDYYVPPGYSTEPVPPAQPYPAPVQAQPSPQPPPAQPVAQPYAQQPYAQPYQDPSAQPYRGRRRLERLRRDEPTPPGVEVMERRRLVLSLIGAGVFAGSYLLPVAVMVDSGLESRRVFLPVAGVLLENAHSDFLFGGSWALAVLDASVQTVGLTLFAIGMRRQRYAVYYVETARGRTLALSPSVGRRGLSLRMAF